MISFRFRFYQYVIFSFNSLVYLHFLQQLLTRCLSLTINHISWALKGLKLCRFTHTVVINILASLELHAAMFVL